VNILGSTFGRALAGGGMAAADLANRYITADLQAQRDQAMADIQRNSAVQQAKEIDQYLNDPTRREVLRAETVKDTEAVDAQRLKGDINRANSKDLTDAEGRRAGAIAKASATATAEVQRDATLENGSDPKYIAALTKIAEANRDPSAVAAHAAQTALAQFQLASAKKVAALQDTLTKAIAAGDTKAEEQARSQLEALQGKGGKAEKFYAVAEAAGRAMAPALKILADPAADPAAKEEAQQLIKSQQALMEAAAKRAGVDLGGATTNEDPILKALQANRDAAGNKGGGGKPAVPAASGQDKKAADKSTEPELSAIDRQIYSELQPLATEYADARAKFQAAARSGDQNAIAYWQKPLVESAKKLRQAADSRLGNGAQRYLQTLNFDQ
jgi:hypothetical protein